MGQNNSVGEEELTMCIDAKGCSKPWKHSRSKNFEVEALIVMMFNNMLVMMTCQLLIFKGLMSHSIIRGDRSIVILTGSLLLIQWIRDTCFCPLASLLKFYQRWWESSLWIPCPFLCPFHLSWGLPQVSRSIPSVPPALTIDLSIAGSTALVLLRWGGVGAFMSVFSLPGHILARQAQIFSAPRFHPTYLGSLRLDPTLGVGWYSPSSETHNNGYWSYSL